MSLTNDERRRLIEFGDVRVLKTALARAGDKLTDEDRQLLEMVVGCPYVRVKR